MPAQASTTAVIVVWRRLSSEVLRGRDATLGRPDGSANAGSIVVDTTHIAGYVESI